MVKTRITYLDILRLIACLMVVLMHSPLPTDQSNSMIVSGLGYFCAPCIGLFLMVSGALLLPVQGDAVTFLKKRLGKLLAPTLVWSIFYILVKWHRGGLGLDDVVRSVLSMPFSPQGHGVLWFMYMLIGLYIIAPVISPWLASVKKSTIELYLGIWALTLCFPLIENYILVDSSIDGLFYYTSGYLGYFIAGYYLYRYGLKINLWMVGCLLTLAVMAPLICVIGNLTVDFYRLFWYLSIFVVSMALAWFVVIQRLMSGCCNYQPKWIQTVSDMSFGVYLSHIFIMRSWVWHWDWILDIGFFPVQIAAIFSCSFVISLCGCYIVSFLPFSEYIIGCSRRKLSLR